MYCRFIDTIGFNLLRFCDSGFVVVVVKQRILFIISDGIPHIPYTSLFPSDFYFLKYFLISVIYLLTKIQSLKYIQISMENIYGAILCILS